MIMVFFGGRRADDNEVAIKTRVAQFHANITAVQDNYKVRWDVHSRSGPSSQTPSSWGVLNNCAPFTVTRAHALASSVCAVDSVAAVLTMHSFTSLSFLRYRV